MQLSRFLLAIRNLKVRRAALLFIAVMMFTSAIIAGVYIQPAYAAAPPKPHGPTGVWKLRFQDEFSGKSVDRRKWADTLSAESDSGRGNPNNGQLEWNSYKNCSVSDGNLKITAKKGKVTSPSKKKYKWTSCLLSSSKSYSFKYGYIEARVKMPKKSGFWATFWTWTAPGGTRQNETDVFEYWRSNKKSISHYQHTNGVTGCKTAIKYDAAAGYHIYGADINARGTDFYIDGRKVCHVNNTHLDQTNIVLSNFVHRRIPPKSSSVGVMKVDYVRAWQR